MIDCSSSEDKIKAAAKRVFILKGFSGCTSREIARESGMNVALVNYYFRSKDKLFQIIFQTVLEEFMLSMYSVFSSDAPLQDKIKVLIEREYDFISKNPEIPGFIINELSRENKESSEVVEMLNKISASGVMKQAEEAQQRGEMRKIDIIGISLLVTSNCQYPFIAKSLIRKMHGLSDNAYLECLETHKKNVTEMILTFLFPNPIIN
jgi:TetR/AcrR family transcriptional regulator